jgi:hypothetical protein
VKKKLILTSLVLCFSLSFYAMEQFNAQLWSRINSTFGTNKIVFTMTNSDNLSRTEVVELLVEGVKKYHVNLKTAYFSNGVQTNYLLLSEQEKVFKNLSLIAKDHYDFSNSSQDFYFTTDKSDTFSNGYLYTVFPSDTNLVQYHSFYDIASGDAQLFGWYNISSEDLNKSKEFATYLKEMMPNSVNVMEMSYDESSKSVSRNEIILISFVLFLLLILLEVSKNMKEISLRKSMGENFLQIEFSLFKSYISTTIMSCFAFFVLSYFILIRTFNPFVLTYIYQLVFYFLLITCMTFVLVGILGGVIFLISPITIIKNRNINQAIFNFNFVLKIVFIVFLFPQILSYAQNANRYASILIDYYTFQETIKSNVVRSGLNPNSMYAGNQIELTKQSKIYVDYAVEKSDFYLKYQEQNLPDDMWPNSVEYINYIYIEVTKNFFENYPFVEKKLDFSKIEEPIILIYKDRRKDIKFNYRDICQECKVIVTSTSYRIPNFTGISRASYLNPVLVIYPSIKNIPFKNMTSFYYHASNSREAIQKRDELIISFKRNWSFTNQDDSIRRVITETSIQTYYAIIVLIQSLAALLLIILHGITVLYDLNKKEISIHYLAGYSFFQRSAYIVMQDAMLFFLLWTYLIIQKFPLIEALIYASGVVIFNLIFASFHLLRNEKNQAIDAIKNG